jgi:hypothetical protein
MVPGCRLGEENRHRIPRLDRPSQRTPGGKAIATLSRRGASIEAILSELTPGQEVGLTAIIDVLFERDTIPGSMAAHRPRRPRLPDLR